MKLRDKPEGGGSAGRGRLRVRVDRPIPNG